ncbi:RIP metalloprotease RseP [Megalodesulfovibrio paquesii]
MDVSQLLNSTVAIVVTLGVLIAFHEFGHFLVAKLLGMGVKTFSVGFGPKLLGFQYGRTTYKLSLIPLGGFVALVGEDDNGERVEGFSEREHFHSRPPWQRLLVVFGGPFFNYLLALLLFWGLFFVLGEMRLLPVFKNVRPDSPAAMAGFAPGDKVVSIDGEAITYWKEMERRIQASQGRELRVTVDRGAGGADDKLIELQVKPEPVMDLDILGEQKQYWRIGVESDPEQYQAVSLGPLEAAASSWTRCWFIVENSVRGIALLIEGKVPFNQVSGPIGIAQMVHETAKVGAVAVISFMCFFSINLAIFNLLPIPVLDGGHILFFLIEWVRGRPVNAKFQEWTTKFGLGLLISIMILALYNDVTRKGTPLDVAQQEMEARANATRQGNNTLMSGQTEGNATP